MAELKPCPFCGVPLIPNTDQRDMFVRRYGTHYAHPQSTCYLGNADVAPSEIESWNARADGVDLPDGAQHEDR